MGYIYVIAICMALSLLTTLLYYLSEAKNHTLDKRKLQSKELFRENILKKRLEVIAEQRVKFSKRYKVETMCLQAGLKLSYTEFILISIVSSVVTSVTVGVVMKNIYMGGMFIFIGYILPKQAIMFVKNARITRMEKQIGSFMYMVLKRYDVTKDFGKALELTLVEFRGEQPIYSEVKQTVLEIQLGKPITEAMDGLARRTGNIYMERLSDYYKIASSLGTDEIRKRLLAQAYIQFEENRKAKATMRKEIAGPKREAYIMLASIPMFALYQIATNDSYIDFMTTTSIGRIGTAVISAVFFGCIWFVNAKIGAPIE